MRFRNKFVYIFLWCTAFFVDMLFAQELSTPLPSVPSDTTMVAVSDTAAVDSVPKKANAIEAPVKYTATDSIVMTSTNTAYLYGDAKVNYQQIELNAEKVQMNLDSSMVYAKYGLDSLGAEYGYPLFKEGEQSYESKTMKYNFNSKKGFITNVITQQGEGYLTANKTKKMDNDILNMKGGRYTTCDNHDHPHFYLQMTKAKVRPNKSIVTGPVYLVIEDVPLPLGLPFAFFPFTSTYSSGILMPTFGEDNTRGFYLRDGGYYFALSDYVDLALTGELYSLGSWGLSARSTYRKRYKFSGNFNASYLTTVSGDKGLPDYSLSKDFKINWTHTQDAKANPFRSFSASVNLSTSSYDRNQLNSIYNSDMTQNTKGSSVNITQRFPNSPFSLSASLSVNQRSKDSSISVTLPDVSLTMSRIYPLKRKKRVGKERWYEKISMSYNGYLRNSIDTKENLLFQSNLVKDWKNGMEHTVPISATFTALKYLNISPSFTYKERWYTHSTQQEYDMQKQSLVVSDTTYGFNRVWNYNASVSLSTTLYGFFKPLPFLGDKVQMIRHRMEPSISLSAAPDFGDPRYGYYKTVVAQDLSGLERAYEYSPFEGQMFSPPGKGKQGNISLSLNNNIEMKIRSDKDSTGFKKINLIDKLSMGMSYNMAVDSFQWSDLSVGLRLKLTKSYTLQLNGIFDTYTYGYNPETKAVRRLNIPRWNAGKGLGRLKSTGTSFSYTLNNETFKKLFGGKDEDDDKGKDNNSSSGSDAFANTNESMGPSQEENGAEGGRLRGAKKDTNGELDADGYYMNKVPWSLSFNYSMRLGYDTKRFDPESLEYKYALTHALSFNGSLSPTKDWKLNFNATYDFDTNQISYMTCNITRNLHCFQMTASFIPVGPYKSYTFSIAVSSSLLKDLKYNQRNSHQGNQTWY